MTCYRQHCSDCQRGWLTFTPRERPDHTCVFCGAASVSNRRLVQFSEPEKSGPAAIGTPRARHREGPSMQRERTNTTTEEAA